MENFPEGVRLPARQIEGIKLVACDMDGTALNEDKEFSEATLEAFAALKDRGIAFTIVSARTPFMLGVFCRQAGIGATPVIALEGSEVISAAGGEPLYDCPIAPAEAAEICAHCHKAGLDYTIYTARNCYLRRDTRRMWRFDLYDRTAAAHSAPPVPTAVYEETSPEAIAAERVYKIFIDNPDDNQRAELEEYLIAYPDVRTDCSEGRSMSITRREASKRAALEMLAQMLGLKREEVCCFGDWHNDVGMLSAFPNSVAMLNGVEESRAAAGYVTLPNSQDGVAFFIQRYVLGNTAWPMR